MPRKSWLVGGGFEWTVATMTLVMRMFDRYFGTRLSVYGWVFVFSRRELNLTDVPPGASVNVCVRCGSGHMIESIVERVMSFAGVRFYRCPQCEGFNFLTLELPRKKLFRH